MKPLFNYLLAPLSISLAEADGTLKRTPPKSVLLHKLEKDVEPVTKYLNNSVYAADGMEVSFRKFKPLKSTYGAFAVSLLKCSLSNGNRLKRTDVVFDVSKSNSIKDVERNKRSSGELSMQKLLRNM